MAAMNPCAFARPPPPGFVGDLLRPRASVRRPARPPGFPPLPARAVNDPVAPDDGAFLMAPVKSQASCNGSGPDFEVPVQPRHHADQRVAPTSKNKNSTTTRPRFCSDYDEELDSSMKAREKNPEERPSPDYLNKIQGGRMDPSTRALLVMGMNEFVRDYDLPAGTLHSAVNYVDRVLSVRPLTSPAEYQLRLLGAAAVFTAAKFEDQRTTLKLNANEIARYGGFATAQEVINTEGAMVAALGYQLGGPTAYTFIGHFTRYSQGEEDLQVQRLAHRIADRWLHSYESLGYLPSAVAASAIFLARFALNPPDVLAWSMELQEMTGYNSVDLFDCVHAMYSSCAVPRMYSSCAVPRM